MKKTLITLIVLSALTSVFSQQISKERYVMEAAYALSGRVQNYLNEYSISFKKDSVLLKNSVREIKIDSTGRRSLIQMPVLYYKMPTKAVLRVIVMVKDDSGNINILIQTKNFDIEFHKEGEPSKNIAYVMLRLETDKSGAESFAKALRKVINEKGGGV